MGASDRDFDIVVFGATGFTGELTARYLAEHAPDSVRIALAGRDETRLAAVRAQIAEAWPQAKLWDLVAADAAQPMTLKTMAARTGSVVSTVGPYLAYGEPLVAACAASGTDYLDLTGEPEFVDTMFLRHHETAQATGARLVHACGFDSIPHDLGAYYTIQQLGQVTGPVHMRGVVRAAAGFSGGTFHSALNAFARARQMQAAHKERRGAEQRDPERSARAVAARPTRDDVLGLWLLPLPTIDPQIVARSAAALPTYGPQFRYSHFAGIRRLPTAIGGAAGVVGLFGAAQIPPLRKALLARVPQGHGPDEARREKSWFSVDFIAESEGQRLHTRVSGGDPGYGETSKMLAESALCLALDDVPPTAGQVTTAQAMGDALLTRLVAAGIRFERR